METNKCDTSTVEITKSDVIRITLDICEEVGIDDVTGVLIHSDVHATYINVYYGICNGFKILIDNCMFLSSNLDTKSFIYGYIRTVILGYMKYNK